jgi:hypothetical protein
MASMNYFFQNKMYIQCEQWITIAPMQLKSWREQAYKKYTTQTIPQKIYNKKYTTKNIPQKYTAKKILQQIYNKKYKTKNIKQK